jgi:cyclophilin family peptidyl-prolyl cis-trans isomerase/protein-disulfide isomerase
MNKKIMLIAITFWTVVAACQAQSAQVVATVDPNNLPTAAPTEAVATCTVVSQDETSNSDALSPYPAITEDDWVRGSDDPTITIIEYTDFQCPLCSVVAPMLKQLADDYPNDLRLVSRPFPLMGRVETPEFDKTALATQAAFAAGLQGGFWEMHDLLFEKYMEWIDMDPSDFEVWLIGQAGELELDKAKFSLDLVSDEAINLPNTAWAEGLTLGLAGVPTIVIDGQPYQGPLNHENLDYVVKLAALKRRQFHECPEMTIDPLKQYFATIVTEKGDIVIELYPDVAPFAVNSFVFLAGNDWYDDVSFHRVLEGFMAQGGDPSGTGAGGPGYLFSIEVSSDLTFDREGLFAMANSGPTSNGSQFFITFAPAQYLDGQFTILGEVVEGMDVVRSLTLRDPSQPDQPEGDLILDVIIEEK